MAISLLVSPIAAGLAGLTALVSLLVYIIAADKQIYIGALVSYYLMTATAAVMIVSSGDTASPFIALWMLLSVFGGIFGFSGLGVLLALNAAYAVYLIGVLHVSHDQLFVFGLGCVLPLLISFVSWHRRARHNDDKDRAYKELAQELSQVSNKSEIVINAIADGVMAIDGHGIIQLINPAALEIMGWTLQDALELDYRSVVKMTNDKNEAVTDDTDPVQQVLRSNELIKTSDFILQTNAGKKMNISLLVSPAGQLGTGAIIVFRDITSEVSENQQKAEFISTASHEMRTPVAAIEGYLGLALNPQTATIDDKARTFLTKAHESAQHLGRLFQDLLDISKAEDGRLNNTPHVIDIVAFLRDVVGSLQPTAQAKGIVMVYKPDTDPSATVTPLYYAHVDPDHLREVSSNLIENAIKYTPQGDVSVDIDGNDTHITISIKDTGIGIPAEDLPHLFQKFYRVDNSDTREIGGTGLGLYLCRRLVEAMSGRVWAESEYQKGSTFFIELPRLSSDDAMQQLDESIEQATTPMIQHHDQQIQP